MPKLKLMPSHPAGPSVLKFTAFTAGACTLSLEFDADDMILSALERTGFDAILPHILVLSTYAIL